MMPTKFVAALATMLSFVTAQADTIKVNPDGSGDYTTIGAAIVAAEPGAVIEVAEGTYPGTVNITKSLTLKGAGRGKSIIDGAGVRRCVAIASGVNDVVLDGFTFVRGKNAASDGLAGGLYADGGTGIFVVDSTFENCVSHKGGAIASTTASGVAAVRCLFTGNESLNAYGTGSEALHQVDAYYCVFTRSYAQYVNGSGDAPVNGPCTLVNCTFANTGYYAYFIKGGVKAYNCIFARSAAKAGSGAGDYLYSCVCSGVGSVGGTSDGDTTAAGGDDYHFVNMLKDDYRLVETSSALGKGNCDYLAQIPETYRLKDFNGNTVDPTGTVNAGAVAVGSVKPAGARIQIFPWSQSTGDIVVDGVTNRFDNYFTGSDYTRYLYNSARIHLYFHSESWPTFHHVKLLGTDGSTVWGLAASGRDDTYRYPESDGEFVFMPPPYEEGHCLQLDAKAAGTVLYVDDDSTAAEPDGTIGNEFNKIQDAVDKVAKNAFAIIHVAAGTYDQGGSNYCPFSVPVIKSRVNVHDKSVRLIGAGAESTFIVGEPDPNAAADKYGLGTGATRCVTACSACSVEGFTLTGGHTSTTTSYCDSFGGALSAEGTSAAVLRVSDCVISNNWANYAPVADATYGKAKTILSRCRILDNVSVAGPAWAKEIVSQSSLWAFNRTLNKTTDRNVNVWSGSVACIFDSTWYAVADDFNFMGYIALMDADKTVFRNVVCQGSGAVRNHCADGCVIDTVIPVPDGAAAKTTYVTALTGEYKAGAGIARFVDPENGDFRVKSTSGAVGAAFYKYDPVNDQTLNSNAYIFATCSLDGVYPDFAANEGWFAAGAYRRPVPVAVTAGENIRPQLDEAALTPGEALAFTFAATRTYPSHLQINGEDVPDSDEGCTYIVPENTEGLLVTEVRNTDIYVAKDGSDTNPGTVARPKLTLKGGLDVARSGDTVHVGPGDYNTLTMTPTPAPSVACRAWVRSGVTLVSTDGAAVTRILGESSIAADNVSGCGAGAVHGVKLEANATIGGFTIANGRGAYAKDAGGNLIAKTEDFGGNVYAADNTARICDCIISNGCAVIAGGGQYGSYYRCRFLDNSTIGNTAAARSANLYGCFVSGSAGTWCTDLIADCQQCTFGENSAAGSNGDLYRYGGATVANTIFTGGVIYSTDGLQVVNCVFKDGAVLKPNGEKTCKTPGCQFDVVAADLQFEADGLTPIVGRNVAVDKGNKDVFVAELGETDLNGNARFQNGLKLDIGAAEGDWRATYAAKLGRRIEVTAADPSVELGDDGVRLPAGAKLALAWKTGIDTTCAFQAVLDGDALAVAKDGVPWKTLDASGEQKFVTSGSVTELSFEMGANGESLLSRFHREIGMSLTVR